VPTILEVLGHHNCFLEGYRPELGIDRVVPSLTTGTYSIFFTCQLIAGKIHGAHHWAKEPLGLHDAM